MFNALPLSQETCGGHTGQAPVTLAGGLPGAACETQCFCSLFTYTCIEICDGRIINRWDAGTCVSW